MTQTSETENMPATYFARVTLHLYDTFDPPMPSQFMAEWIKPQDYGAVESFWVPQTIADQIWVFCQFADNASRDRYIAQVQREIAVNVRGYCGGKVASSARIASEEEVEEWVKPMIAAGLRAYAP